MKRLDWPVLAADYAQYHRHPKNRLCHALGIPLIVFCVVRWTLAGDSPVPLAAAALPLYLYWDAALGLAMAALLIAMGAAARALPAWSFAGFFALGWALQLLGHRFEGRSPAFTRNFLHLLVGPFWILRETVQLFLR
jgi:uncharacterized membrane protein YGL010W